MVLFYALYKWRLLIDRSDSRLVTTVVPDYFAGEKFESFGQEQGFSMAYYVYVGGTNEVIKEIDPAIGSVSLLQITQPYYGKGYVKQKLKTHGCTSAD